MFNHIFYVLENTLKFKLNNNNIINCQATQIIKM